MTTLGLHPPTWPRQPATRGLSFPGVHSKRSTKVRRAIAAIALVSSTLLAAGISAFSSAASANVSFIAFGDAGTLSSGQLALRDRMVARSSEYQLALLLGDGAYPVGSTADFASKFFPVYGSLFQGSGQVPPPATAGTPKPLYATPGNHEYDTAGAAGFHTVFAMPTNGPAGVPSEKFYSVDIGGVHFVSFDSHYVVGWNMSTPTSQKDAIRNWLISDLDSHVNEVTVVFDHHPAYTGGPHRGELEESAMRADWFPIFAGHGVDLLLSAHDHSYQRNHPQAGLTSYVTGGGGGALTAITPQSYTAASLSDYHFVKVAVSGCTISTVAVRSSGAEFDPWSYAAPTCSTTGPTASPGASAPPGTLLSDGFEAGNFGQWTSVVTGGEGSATVQTGTVKTGTHAARLSATATTGSRAYAREDLLAARTQVRVSGQFRIDAEGAAGGNVPLIRVYDSSGVRILQVYRQNAAGNRLYAQHSGAFNTTTGLLPLATWASVELRMVVNGAASTVQIWLNGALIHSTTSASLGTAGVRHVQIGNDTAGQAFTLFADDIVVTDGTVPAPPSPGPSAPGPSASLPAPSNSAVPPSPVPSPSSSPAPTSQPGTWFSDGFESGTLNAWTVRRGTTGQVSVTTNGPRTGTYAAFLSATSAGGSNAYARASLGGARTTVDASLAVRIQTEGAVNGNVPLVRLLNGSGSRIVTVYRQNQSSDRVYVSYGGTNFLTSGRLALNTWGTVRVIVSINASGSSLEVRLNGVTIHTTSSASLGSLGLATLQIGNDTNKQAFAMTVDDVVVTP